MKNIIKNNYKYVITFIFVFILIWWFGFCRHFGDPIANYGFSHALINGEIPYLDFNTISTPLYLFYQAIGLLIWDNFNMFLLGQALLVTISFFILYNLYGKKVYLYLLVTISTLAINIVGTYNYMCFFMMLIIIYLEKKYSNKDYLIGFCICLAVLSKHTVGAFLIIPSIIFFYKNKEKLLKRFIGFIIPLTIFLLYLLITKSLFSFIDLCILGLFDFASKNGATAGKINTFFLISTIILILISLYIILKNKKEISNYYLFFGVLFAIPLFDFTHFMMYFNCFLAIIIPYIKINDKLITNISIYSSIIILLIVSINMHKYITIYTNNHFKYTLSFKLDCIKKKKIHKYFSKFDNSLIVSYDNMEYSIVNDRKIDYFSIPLYGNFGYNGINKMIKKIEKSKNKVFIVSKSEYKSKKKDSQFAKEIVKYIMDNYKKIDSKYGHEVYYRE